MRDSGFDGNSGAERGAGLTRSCILHPASCKGFTLIELIVVVSIIVVIAGIFLVRIPYYQEQAEKAALQQVTGGLQSALVLRYSTLMTRNAASEKELGELVSGNPITWLQKPPPNYMGEYFDPGLHTIAAGNWMFDLKSRELIYVVDHGDNFIPGKDGKKWIRFHVHLDYEPALGRPESGKELATTLFEPTEPYHWFN
jgi:general secretion pathway protein G